MPRLAIRPLWRGAEWPGQPRAGCSGKGEKRIDVYQPFVGPLFAENSWRGLPWKRVGFFNSRFRSIPPTLVLS